MRGLRINFGSGGARLDLAATVSGLAALAQNALVNIGTHAGSDPVFPTRGTGLMRAAVEGRLVNATTARHHANFAAVDTLFFMRGTDPAGETPRLARVWLTQESFDGARLTLSARFESTEGTSMGTLADISEVAQA